MATISIALAALVIGYFVGHRMGVKAGRFDARFQIDRTDGMFQAAVAESNDLKVKLSTALIALEDARK